MHKIVNWLIDNSYFCNYVVATITRLNDFPRFRGFPVVDRQRLLAIRELMENDRGQRVSLPDVYEIASQYDDEGNFLGAYGADGWPENPATRYKIEVATLRLRQLRDECKKRGTDKILVCIIPSRLMGDFPDVSTEVEQLRGLGLISNRFAVTGKYFTDRMDAILQRDGFSTVNIGTVIHDKHLPLGRELYWPVDGHFNVTGYRMMGEAIAQRLIQLGWISKN
ncbi:MAG: hypothetical protein JO102_03580 [Elusimicrobia bacterium]|nr:hypothetical protein [Elusimicrobiota bacterium]